MLKKVSTTIQKKEKHFPDTPEQGLAPQEVSLRKAEVEIAGEEAVSSL
jgi:hypothetical protein